MRRLYRFLPACMLALMPMLASAQGINSTVEVRKAYEGKLQEVHKPLMEIMVPDSVTKFDLEFDYDRFSSSYTSSYEFRPHLLDLKPNAEIDNGNRLYLKVGAGYTLHPDLDVVWSPKLKNSWKLNLYASHHSYVGNYYRIGAPDTETAGLVNLGRMGKGKGVQKYFGYDLVSTAGLDSRYDWKNSVLMMDLDYYGLAQKDWMKARSYNALDAGIRVFSKSVKPNRFHYDVRFDYRFAGDDADYKTGPDHLLEHDFKFNAVIGPVMQEMHQVMFDMGFDGTAYSGALNSFAGNIFISSKYVYERGRWDIRAGVKFSKLVRNSEDPKLHKSAEQYVYPDVNISFTAIKNGMDIYLKAVGGNDINAYSSILESHHFADYRSGYGQWPAINNNIDRISSALGFRGRITPNFSYDICGGYENHASAMVDALYITSEGLFPALGYASYQNAFATVDLRFDSNRVTAAVAATYNYTDFLKSSKGFFAPSEVRALASVMYNWNRRIYAGIDCEFASGRRAVLDKVYRIKPYTDLGLYFEYKHTSRLSFWARGGNILFQTIQRNPMYAEKGGNFTVGICLNM